MPISKLDVPARAATPTSTPSAPAAREPVAPLLTPRAPKASQPGQRTGFEAHTTPDNHLAGTPGTKPAPVPTRAEVHGVTAPKATHTPLGASLFADKSGTTFGVWAPNAAKVFVSGDFNHWGKTELKPDGKGNFSAGVKGALAGQSYKYVVETKDGKELWRNDPRALQMTPITAKGPHGENGNSVIYDDKAYTWHDQSFKAAPKNKQIVYELHVGTFNPVDGKPGTFTSAIDKLDTLKKLGINTIELLPIEESKGDSNWGYDPEAPFAPESAYGSPDDMKKLIDAAHARGIAVAVDWVPNHMSGDDANVLKNFDGTSAATGPDGAYFYPTPSLENTGFGPRPDYSKPEVRQYLRDNMQEFWKSFHFDTVRIDSTVNVRTNGKGTPIPEGLSLLKQISDDAHAAGKEVIFEDLQDASSLTRPTAKGGAGADAQWDPGHFFYPMRDVVTQKDDVKRDMGKVVQAITQQYNGDGSQRVIFMENHDVSGHPADGQVRIPTAISPNSPEDLAARKRSTLAAGLMLTSPGIPMEFQGQELLETKTFTFDKTPGMDWSREQKFAGIEKMYGDMNALRTNAAGNTAGLTGNNVRILQQNDARKVVAYQRWDKGGPGDDTIVIANFSGKPITNYDVGLPAKGTWKVRFNGDSKGYSPDFTGAGTRTVDAKASGLNGQPFSGSVTVGPYSIIVLSQDKGPPAR